MALRPLLAALSFRASFAGACLAMCRGLELSGSEGGRGGDRRSKTRFRRSYPFKDVRVVRGQGEKTVFETVRCQY